MTAVDAIRERHRAARDRGLADLSLGPWIGGEPIDTGETVETVDPTTTEPVAEVAVCDVSTVDHAVETAWNAFDGGWADTPPAERSRLLLEWIDVLESHADELTLLETLDTGKPISDARGEIEGAIETLEYYAAVIRSRTGDQLPAGENLHVYTRHEPYGVVGQVTPWNFPAWAAAWKLGPALAAGNCAVLKPSVSTPLTTVRMAQLSADVFPDGVLNVVTGGGSTVGEALVSHDEVRKVSFTGSGAVGAQVMRAAAARIAPVTLELGGKSPVVVFPDADLKTAVETVADGIFYSTGEICDALSRTLVHEDIHDAFLDRFVERAESYVLGDPLDDATTMGPLTTAGQLETVLDYIEVGREEGARLVTGGGRPDVPVDGHYVEPTVFADVENDMRIAREEIFGPVQTVQSFASYDEAIRLANDTRFGLAAGIVTRSTDRVHRTAADLDAGVIYVNDYGPIRPEGPYGGFKESGIGRDLGEAALDHYQQTQTVYVNLGDPST